ncbi:expressed unknown protein [Seminavis robusta]|uniref:NYN domain-containing protein n=1 Tax=Seminavis robusta TaxID=568900 RepID=A0A9N8DRL4_9STRA|nr:expressed unknown protein [Seminavis robusta]|eukprot:Sro230_g093470.1 n/a (373) ;mRNA; r:77159-78277
MISLTAHLHLLLLLLVLLTHHSTDGLASSHSTRRQRRKRPVVDRPSKPSLLQTTHGSILVVDVENVRGKSGFALSHVELMHKIQAWKQQQLQILLVVDHGNEPSAFYDNDGMAIVLAGPSRKADDVIAQDCLRQLSEQQQQQKDMAVMVVTDDQGLVRRCHKHTRLDLQIVSSWTLLEELERFEQQQQQQSSFNSSSSLQEQEIQEIDLAAEWMMAVAKQQAVQHKHIPNKRKRALQYKIDQCQQPLLQTPLGRDVYQFAKQHMETTTASTKKKNQDASTTTTASSTEIQLDPNIQSAVLQSWQQLKNSLKHRVYHKETTQDRIVLAEQFRIELQKLYGSDTQQLVQQMIIRQQQPAQEDTGVAWSTVQRYV